MSNRPTNHSSGFNAFQFPRNGRGQRSEPTHTSSSTSGATTSPTSHPAPLTASSSTTAERSCASCGAPLPSHVTGGEPPPSEDPGIPSSTTQLISPESPRSPYSDETGYYNPFAPNGFPIVLEFQHKGQVRHLFILASSSWQTPHLHDVIKAAMKEDVHESVRLEDLRVRWETVQGNVSGFPEETRVTLDNLAAVMGFLSRGRNDVVV
ncbi:MAG: hypothetical protein Q9210_005206, partial [Variospora velana]